MRRRSRIRSGYDLLLARLLANDRASRGNVGARSSTVKKSRGLRRTVFVMIPVVLILTTAFWFYQDDSWRHSTRSSDGSSRAAIIDQLSGTVPDPWFVSHAQSALGNAGYTVDYYGPAEVTVSLFRGLPLKGYDLIVIRSHSGGEGIYTGETYDTSKYVWEQLTDQIIPVTVGQKVYFGITHQFVQESMHGSFPGSLVVVMGCGGLVNTNMAQAFLVKGAKDYVGWDGAVNSAHTDLAVETLIQYLSQGNSVRDSVSLTAGQVGRDPLYGGRLSYFDSKVGLVQQLESFFISVLIGLVPIMILPVLGCFVIILVPRLFGKR